MGTLAAVMTLAFIFAGGSSVPAQTAGIVDSSPSDAWYALPDVDGPQCLDLAPLPWCEASTIPTLRKFLANIGAPFDELDSEVAITISRYSTCWIRLRGYANCSQQMCFAAGVFPPERNPGHPIMLVTVYKDHSARQDMASVSQYELGPSFSFDLRPLTWSGPSERVENAMPCK